MMVSYEIIDGNILDARPVDYICHQVNCQGKMGSGVALAIRNKHSKVYYEYLEYLNECNVKGVNPLGTIQLVTTNCDSDSWDVLHGTAYVGVINMFAQDKYGYNGKQYTSIDAFQKCLEQINELCAEEIVAFPWKIGCVRGGANWDTIMPMILNTLTKVRKVVFYRYDAG